MTEEDDQAAPARKGASGDKPARRVNLGRGTVVPYPNPSNAAATKIGKANRRTDTKPEVRLRSALHRQGFRFRKDHLLRVDDLKVRPDIVFTRAKIAVFIDGCFWHCCPAHQTIPKRNAGYWVPKLQANVERDERVNAILAANGWHVIRIWEHEDIPSTANRVAAAVSLHVCENSTQQGAPP